MNHDEVTPLLGAYRDGELDLATCVKLEEHLAGCPECQQKMANENELVALIQEEAPRFKPSPFLETRIRAALREEKSSATEAGGWWKRLALPWVLSGAIALVACVAVIAACLSSTGSMPEFAKDAVDGHARSLQANHLMDVASTDQHTVKPWFAGKLPYSPQVVDLTPSGYPLIGGRLDVLARHDVAAIIYQRRKHYINLFIWPSGTEPVHGHYNQDGYHLICWTKAGMNYIAVSELGEKELKDFAQMIQEQTVDPTTGE